MPELGRVGVDVDVAPCHLSPRLSGAASITSKALTGKVRASLEGRKTRKSELDAGMEHERLTGKPRSGHAQDVTEFDQICESLALLLSADSSPTH